MKTKYLFIAIFVSCVIFMFIKNSTVAATTSSSEITGTLPTQNKNIDDRVFLIYGYQIKENIVKLNHANTVYNISILGDNDNFIYFCLDERKYNPSDGELNILQPNGQLLPEINWLFSNFYNNIESFKLTENTPNKSGGNSPVSSFNNANFYNKYVYTQLAIWHFTNPSNFPMTSDVIKNNPEVVALINEANKNKDFYNPTYNQAVDAINDIHYEASDLVKESEDNDTYIFSTTVVKSGSNELFDIKDIDYVVSLQEKNQLRDVTKEVTITPKSKNKIYIHVPKELLNESEAKLTVAATASVTSDKAFTTYYDNENNKQPVAGAYKLNKSLYTEKSIEINNQTHYSVYKRWSDNNNQDGKRPTSITVQLYSNDQALGNPIILNAENSWQYTWNELDTKTNGQEVDYSVRELGTIEPYIPSITTDENGLATTITNSYTPEVTQLSGEKIWNDSNNQDGKRPDSVIVNLLADGEEVDQKIVTPNQDGQWVYEFTNLTVYQNGKKINYSVTEDTVPDYSTEVNGTTIVNSYTPGKTSVSIAKMWDDQNNQDNLRPNNIQVQLYGETTQGKTPIGTAVTLDETNQWATMWSDLPLMDNGEQIKYTVEEVKQSVNLPGYTTTVDDSNHGNIIITNRHDVEMTTIQGQKIWNDGDNQDGIRPDQITVILYANGVETNRKIVSESENWVYEFNDLPVYSQGEKIKYTVEEVPVSGYESELDGASIKNTHIPETTTITGAKTWHDKDNQDGIRPGSLIIILFANGTEVARQTVTEETNWVYEFRNLPKNSNGQEIDYTIEEGPVPGYDSKIEDINLLNTHVVDKTKISGNKLWDDENNNDRKRPESITVYLYADGELIKQQEVKPDSDGVWSYEFDHLDKNKDRKEIQYTIKEEQVPYYETTINGTDLINHYTSEVTEVKGKKTWDDENNQDGTRPKSITVHLVANGNIETPVATQIVDDSTNWTYSFVGLPVYQDGKKITYTVIEDKVFDYTTTIDGYNIINTYIAGKTEIAGTKTWDDKNNQDGKRPNKITVNLLANGEKIDEKIVTESDNWSYKFTDLPKYSNGKEITYTITENNVPNYSLEMDGSNLINHYTPGQTSVTVTKFWDDENNQDGKRPYTIKVQLYADEEIVGEPIVLNVENNWEHTWTNLDEKANGKDIQYTVKEKDTIPEYEMTVNDENIGNIIITNSYSPKKIATSSNDVPTSSQTNSKNTTSIPSLGELSTRLYVLLGTFVVIIVLLVYKLRRRQL